MTTAEKTGIRPLDFSRWIKEKLPDSATGYSVTDVDFFLYNYKTKKLIVLEIKTFGASLKPWQRVFYAQLNQWLKKGMPSNWEFLGVHLITFENKFFDDGWCKFDNKLISEEELLKKLSNFDI